jgi:hypothetical protein
MPLKNTRRPSLPIDAMRQVALADVVQSSDTVNGHGGLAWGGNMGGSVAPCTIGDLTQP